MGAAEQLQTEEKEEFRLTFDGKEKELGYLQFSVFKFITEGKYDEAIRVLSDYREAKSSYKLYIRQTEKIFSGSIELIAIIKAKMNIPGRTNLMPAKKEEIEDNILENWEILQSLLKRLRVVERDLATADSRSSLLVVKALIFGVMMIFTVFLINEAFRSAGRSFRHFLDDVIALIMKGLS